MLPVKVPLDPPVHGMLGKTAKGFSRFAVRDINLLIQEVVSHFVK
jgi:hypothetical protein